MWEDPQNRYGGKWVIQHRNADRSRETLNKLWELTLISLVTEEVDLEDDICGAVVRPSTVFHRHALSNVAVCTHTPTSCLRVAACLSFDALNLWLSFSRPPCHCFASPTLQRAS